MQSVIGFVVLGAMFALICLPWCCMFSSDELTSDQILWMEEQDKQQMRDAGWTEEEIDEIH